MKKILTILSLLASTICFSQRPIQPLGTKANEVKVLGALGSDTALFVTPYATLAAANVPGQYARTRGGSIIFVKNESALYIRNDAATAWIKIAATADIPTPPSLQIVTDVGDITDHTITADGFQLRSFNGSLFDNSGKGTLSLYNRTNGAFWIDLSPNTLTAYRDIRLPNQSGTIALVSDIPPTISLAPIGSTPNANAATLTGGVLNLQPASTSFGGVVTTTAQSFAGNKIFTGGLESIAGVGGDNSSFRAGNGAMPNITTGIQNIAIGKQAANNITTQNNNVAIGYLANGNVAGNNNIAIGSVTNRGLGGGSGDDNIAIGVQSMQNSTLVNNSNIGIGSLSLSSISNGTSNIAIGGYAGYQLSTGSPAGNILIGAGAGTYMTQASNNIMIGYSVASTSSLNGVNINNNVYVGAGAGSYATGSNNVFIGNQTGYNETGSNRLYVDNAGGVPILYGEFDNDLLRVNGRFEVNANAGITASFLGNFYLGTVVQIDGTQPQLLSYASGGVRQFATGLSDYTGAVGNGGDGTPDYALIHGGGVGAGGLPMIVVNGVNGYVQMGAWTYSTLTPTRRLVLYERSGSINQYIPLLKLQHETFQAVAAGFGTGVEYELWNTNAAAFLLAGMTGVEYSDVSAASADGDYVIKLMQNGAAYAEKFRVLSTGEIKAQLLNQDDAEAKIVTWNSTDKLFEWRSASSLTGGGSGGYTNMTQFLTQTPYRLFISDLNGDVQELPYGTNGQLLTSNGTSANPSWTTPSTLGEANTASNVGGGLANFNTKSGVNLQFNTFNSTDFSLAASVISIAYASAQAASGTLKGFLTSADWTMFSNKNSGILFRDEGSALGAAGAVDEIDFVGTGVIATRASNKVTVTVASTGGVNISGTPVANQLAIWTNSNTVKGDANLFWSGSVLTISGAVSALYGDLAEVSSVTTPPSGRGFYYVSSSDSKLHFKNKLGVDYDLTATGTPTGSNTEVQYNNASAFGASSQFTFASGAITLNKTTGINIQLGTVTDLPTATPVELNMGSSFSSTAGANPKLVLYQTGANKVGLGISVDASIDYITFIDGYHRFYCGTQQFEISAAGIRIATVSHDDAETKVLVWNSSAKTVEYRESSTLGGGVGAGSVAEINVTPTTLSLSGAYVYNNGTGTGVFNLPDLATNQGKRYECKNASGSQILTVQRTGTDNIYNTGVVTNVTVNAGQSLTFWAGATYWYVTGY